MSPFAIVILSLSMSADAFAAAVARGAAHRPTPREAIKAGAVFGIVETITPFVGWGLGLAFAARVEKVDHWIAFILLTLVGGHMAWEGLKARGTAETEEEAPRRGAGPLSLVLTALSTSIDAAAVGVSLAFIKANMLVIGFCIGFSTFCLASLGMMIGSSVGRKIGAWAEVVGGLALIGLGGFILLEHLSGRA